MAHINVNLSLVSKLENNISLDGQKEIEKTIWEEVKNNLKKKGVHLDFYYSDSNQCFCLIVLKNGETVLEVMKLIRNKKIYCINKQNILCKKASSLLATFLGGNKHNVMEWKRDVFALGVSDSVLDSVCNYNKDPLQGGSVNEIEVDKQCLVQYVFDEM
jgi:hypothetical protein